MKGDGQTPSLLMVGSVWAGSGSSVAGWGAVSEGAGYENGVDTVGVSAAGERLKIAQGQGCSAFWEDVGRPLGKVEGWLWREMLAFDAGIRVRMAIAIFVGIIGNGVV